MMRNRKNITGINTRITILADIIQKARVVLCADNERIYLNAEETRKIILICLIFYRTKNITFPCETINLEYILSAIKMNDLNIFELSFNDNLQTLELAGALNELSHIDQEPDYFELIIFFAHLGRFYLNGLFRRRRFLSVGFCGLAFTELFRKRWRRKHFVSE